MFSRLEYFLVLHIGIFYFFVDKKKIISLDLYNLLEDEAEALAYWIMGDGTKSGTGFTLQI